MAVSYKLASPLQVGTIANPSSVNELHLTGVNITTTPNLAVAGNGVMVATLKDPQSPFIENLRYNDATVVALWNAPIATPPPGATLGDVIATAVLGKLSVDGVLPAGSVVSS